MLVGLVVGCVAVLALMGAFIAGRQTSPDEVLRSESTATVDELVARAVELHQGGDIEGATSAWEAVLEADAQNVLASYNLGLIAQNDGDLVAAIMRYDAALRHDASFVPALYNRGLARSASGDRSGAIDDLRRAAELSPDDARILFNLGTVLVAAGDEAEGAEALNRAVELDPSLVPAASSAP